MIFNIDLVLPLRVNMYRRELLSERFFIFVEFLIEMKKEDCEEHGNYDM